MQMCFEELARRSGAALMSSTTWPMFNIEWITTYWLDDNYEAQTINIILHLTNNISALNNKNGMLIPIKMEMAHLTGVFVSFYNLIQLCCNTEIVRFIAF